MSCVLQFPEASVNVEFCSEGSKQKILVDVLIKYDNMDANKLANVLGIEIEDLKSINAGTTYLEGEQADALAQLFLMFLGKNFFRNCTLIRYFDD